jgi:hypothetical protein
VPEGRSGNRDKEASGATDFPITSRV